MDVKENIADFDKSISAAGGPFTPHQRIKFYAEFTRIIGFHSTAKELLNVFLTILCFSLI